ncbi:MAG: glycosyltransferase family 2 protein [bacterium]|nr:glycosyltransferase family 2 protein [bacterium]
MRLAIVIPTLDEERTLAVALPHALQAADEVWVSDGGSSDATVEVARSLGARVVTGDAGRGAQLNRGAAAAGSDALLFLHADTRLPGGAADRVREVLASGAVGGGFRLRFEPATGALKSADRWTDLRTRLTGWPLGDQAQFASREAFTALGGFREWPILEDLDFIRRLRKAGRIVIVDDRVITSSRRFQRYGATRTIATNYLIWLLYFAGVSPEKLARLYRKVR